MSDLLGTGSSALLAFQRAIGTTSHNIANVGTEGYSRQRVTLEARRDEIGPHGARGGGVEVIGVERLASEFAAARVRETTSSHAREATHHELASRIDAMLASDALDPRSSFADFFAALEDASLDPSSSTSRNLAVAAGESVAERLANLHGQLEGTAAEVDGRRRASVDRINELSSGIAELNSRLVEHRATGRERLEADLLDRRDRLVERLAAEVDLEGVERPDGSLDVSIGDGVPLVVGAEGRSLRVANDPARPGRTDIELGTGSVWLSVGPRLGGGELGGLGAFERTTLEPAVQRLGRLAHGFAEAVNATHAAGVRPDGAPGGPWFSVAGPTALGASSNAGGGALGATVTDASSLAATDYRLRFDGGAWEITRTSDGRRTTNATLPTTIDGLEITASGTPAAGDTFVVSAARSAAGTLRSEIGSGDELALAEPGAGPGGNANARALAALGRETLIDGATIAADLGTLAGTVGGTAASLDTRSAALAALKNDALERRDSISGVNLDEEAVELVRHEQAYQAAAQIIRTADELFRTMLGVVAR